LSDVALVDGGPEDLPGDVELVGHSFSEVVGRRSLQEG